MDAGATAEHGYIVLAHDWSRHKPFWLVDQLRERGFRVEPLVRHGWAAHFRGRLGTVASRLDTMLLGWQAARRAARQGGCVVATGDYLVGLFASLAPILPTRSRPPVLCVNLIFYENPGLRTRLRKLLHRLALSFGDVRFTASSEELCDHYAHLFQARRDRFISLTDCWAPVHLGFLKYDVHEDHGYVFVGGEAGRDWTTALEVARRLRDIPFMFVARRRGWREVVLPTNVDLRFDLPLGDFMEAMAGARIVLLPLEEGNPTAGLLVVTHAALMGRMIVATHIQFLEQYYPADCRDLLVRAADPGAIAELVENYWNDHDGRVTMAARLRDHMLEQHSPEEYSTRVAAEASRMLAERRRV